MLKTAQKTKVVSKHATKENDTGSPEVQIALFTEEIEGLKKHFKKHPKDKHSRQGLLRLVGKRKSLLDWLSKESQERYLAITKKLGLKQTKAAAQDEPAEA